MNDNNNNCGLKMTAIGYIINQISYWIKKEVSCGKFTSIYQRYL